MEARRGDLARQRARRAAVRVEELTRRRRELSAGRGGVTDGTLAAARLAATSYAVNAHRAAVSAVSAYRSAAAAHRSAAEHLDRSGKPVRAQEHRTLARADDAAATAATLAVDAPKPRPR